MRIRFEIQSLASLGEGVRRLPINCWRLTVQYNGGSGSLIDGEDLATDLSTSGPGASQLLAQFVVGGVFGPDGMPVNLDQVLVLTVPAGRLARGVLIYEYLEP